MNWKKISILPNKKVLLVDDIVTTGYTLAECAAVLMKHGAKEVLLRSCCVQTKCIFGHTGSL